MKVTETKTLIRKIGYPKESEFFVCPNCKETINCCTASDYRPKFCSECGTRLEFEDGND